MARGRGHFPHGGVGGFRGRGWQEKNAGRVFGGRFSNGSFERSSQEHLKNKRSGAGSPSVEGGTKSNIKRDEMGQYQHDKQDTEMVDVAREDEGEGGEGKAGIKCARCTKKGHVAANCTT